MASVSVNTQAAAYQTRHQQFRDIAAYWVPVLAVYAKLGEDERKAWRDSDPFLNDLLRFTKKVTGFKEDVSI